MIKRYRTPEEAIKKSKDKFNRKQIRKIRNLDNGKNKKVRGLW